MCGLAGMIALNGARVDARAVGRMADAMRHRGPDDAGVFDDGKVGLGFRRLAILDLSPGGHQPMHSADGRYVMVFNGEIYNYLELRQELMSKGYHFSSTGDTEVLLNSYRAWGADCLHKFNGMWAFLIYDLQEGVVFGSRDRFGVKPLYRYRNGDRLFFASEIKALLTTGYYAGEKNWQVAAKFLINQRLGDGTETFYQGITSIAPGSAFELHLDGRYREWIYWSLSAVPAVAVDDPAREFAELFEDAVRLRLRSDVPVGVSLSGGLDSTSILCSMARMWSRENPLWAFAYMPAEFDESRYINDTVAQSRARLEPVDIDAAGLLDEIEKFLWVQDEPVHTMTAMIGYRIMELAAKNGVKVMLGGQGADEYLAGYGNYFRSYWANLLVTEGVSRVQREIAAYSEIHGGQPKQMFWNVVKRAVKGKFQGFQSYRALSKWRQRSEPSKNSWFTADLVKQLPDEDGANALTLDEDLRFSIERANLPLYLRIEDRNSMAHSVEARLPFMDYRLISYVSRLPGSWKLNGPWNKYILREAMRGKIPESVRLRPDKMGFPFPADKWMFNGLSESLLGLLDSRAARERGIYNLASIRADIEKKNSANPSMPIDAFNIVQFEIWNQIAAKAGREKCAAHT